MTDTMTEPAVAPGRWMAEFFSEADKLDLPLMMQWFAEDIDLRIANSPPIVGRQAVEQAFAEFWSALGGMSHQVIELLVSDDDLRAAQMSIVTYTRKDGHAVSLPVASNIHRNRAGKLERLWIYIDINPLFAE